MKELFEVDAGSFRLALKRMAEPLTIDEYQSLLHVIPKLKRDNK